MKMNSTPINTPININQIMHKGQPSQSIKFQKGMVFLGKIKEIFPNNIASLQVGSKTYTAKLDVALSLGNTYWFHIEQISSSGVPYITTINNKQMKDPYQQLLEKLNLPKNSAVKSLIMRLFEQQQSIDYANIPTIINWIKGTPALNRETAIQTVLFMLNHNFPVGKPIFDSLMEFFTTESIAEKLTALYDSIIKTEPKSLKMEEFIKWFHSLKQEEANFPNKILSLLGINYEFLLSKESLKQSNIAQLKPLLLVLMENTEPTIKSIASEILKWLSGQQLVNYDSGEKMVNLLFQVPLIFHEVKHDLWLKIQGYKEEGRQINPENHKLFFYVKLSNIRDTVIELTTQKKIISVKIYNENDISNLIEVLTPLLTEKMTAIGFHLSSVKSYKKENLQTYFFTPYSTDQIKVDKRI